MSARLGFAGVAVVATAIAACVVPLWTYALSLALFGLPHVATELRYVDERFGARLRPSTFHGLALLLAAVAVLRALGLAGAGDSLQRAIVELGLGAALVAVTLPMLAVRGPVLASAGAALIAAAVLAAWRAPLDAIVVLALLHNLTPIGFLAERLRGVDRCSALLACATVFVMIPLLIGSGIAPAWCERLGFALLESGPPRVGDLELHLGAFVPQVWRNDALGLDLFRAAAFLQCMHYAVVLHVLPRLGGGQETRGSRLRWPNPRGFRIAVLGIGALFSVAFAATFTDTRAFYGVFAAVHAWIEIPILLLACAVGPTAVRPIVA
ncbi:MAG: hypothetical protein U1F36_01835 [Planctomycetota bacterium]